jgi:hypothetical protein
MILKRIQKKLISCLTKTLYGSYVVGMHSWSTQCQAPVSRGLAVHPSVLFRSSGLLGFQEACEEKGTGL